MKARDLVNKTPLISFDTPVWKLSSFFRDFNVDWLPIQCTNSELAVVHVSEVKASSRVNEFNLVSLEDLVQRHPLVVDASHSVEQVLQEFNLSRFAVAVVKSRDQVIGILTKNRILEFLEETQQRNA